RPDHQLALPACAPRWPTTSARALAPTAGSLRGLPLQAAATGPDVDGLPGISTSARGSLRRVYRRRPIHQLTIVGLPVRARSPRPIAGSAASRWRPVAPNTPVAPDRRRLELPAISL